MNSHFNEAKLSASIVLFKHDGYVLAVHHMVHGTERDKRIALVTLYHDNTRFADKMDVCKGNYTFQYSEMTDANLNKLLSENNNIIYKCFRKKLEIIQINIIIALCRGVALKLMAKAIGESQTTLDKQMKILKLKLGVLPYGIIPLAYFLK